MNIWTTLQGAAHQLAQAQSGYVAAALALYIFSVIVTAVRWRVILSTLARTEHNKTRTAETLHISLKTLHTKLKAYREAGLVKEEG